MFIQLTTYTPSQRDDKAVTEAKTILLTGLLPMASLQTHAHRYRHDTASQQSLINKMPHRTGW